MALTGTSRGSGTHNTAASSRAVSPSGTIPAGSIAVIVWALDNSGTSGVSRFSSMADSVGNTWSTPLNINKTAGTANDGTTLVMSWSKLTTQLLNTNTITITLTGNVTPKCYAIHQITPAAGNSVEYVTSGSTTGTGNVALTTGTIDNLQMVVCAVANEYGTAQTPTHDTDTTNGSWSTALYAEVGTTGAGQNVASQRKVVTASATQTYNVSYSSSANAIVRKTVSPTFAADAVILLPPVTGSFTANAIARKTPSASLTANAAIQKTQTPTGKTADAVIKKEQAGSFSADAIVGGEQAGSFEANAFVEPWFTADAFVEPWFTADARIDFGFTANAVIAMLIWSDDFDRTTESGWGLGYGGVYEPEDVYLDGSSVVAVPNGYSYARTGFPAVRSGWVQFDFWVPPTVSNYGPYCFVGLRSDNSDSLFDCEVWSGPTWGLWTGRDSGGAYFEFTPSASTWYRAKFYFENFDGGTAGLKVWLASGNEPDVWDDSDTTTAIWSSYSRIGIETGTESFKFDNLRIWAAEVPVTLLRSFAADAVIQKTQIYYAESGVWVNESGNVLIVAGGATETIIPNCVLTQSPDGALDVDWNIWYSHDQGWTYKHELIHLRRDDVNGEILATTNAQTGGDGGDTANGHQFFAAGSFRDTSPTTGTYVLTIVSDAGNAALYSDYRYFGVGFYPDLVAPLADAVVLAEQAGSFSADAFVVITTNASFEAEAFVEPWFSADAIIAKLVWSDDFDRVVEDGWGNGYTENHGYGASVDGSVGLVAGDAYYEPLLTGIRALGGLVQFDFYVPADIYDSYVEYRVYPFASDGEFDPTYVRVYCSDTITGEWRARVRGWDWGTLMSQYFTPDASSWYRLKLFAEPSLGGLVGVKVWKIGDPEPDDWYATHESGNFWDAYIPDVEIDAPLGEPARFDNLRIWALAIGPVVASFSADAVIFRTMESGDPGSGPGTLTFYDDYNGDAGTPLSSHTPDYGGGNYGDAGLLLDGLGHGYANSWGLAFLQNGPGIADGDLVWNDEDGNPGANFMFRIYAWIAGICQAYSWLNGTLYSYVSSYGVTNPYTWITSIPWAPGNHRIRVQGNSPTHIQVRSWATGTPEQYNSWDLDIYDNSPSIQRSSGAFGVGGTAGSKWDYLRVEDLFSGWVPPSGDAPDLSADAYIVITTTASFDAEAFVEPWFSADAIVWAAIETGFTADAVTCLVFTADAIVKREIIFTPWVEGGWADPGLYSDQGITLDAVIVGQGYSLTADSLIRREQSSSFAVDAVIDLGMVTEEGSFAADAVALRETSSTLIANAWVEGITTGGFSLDAVKKAGQAGSFTAASIVKKSSTPTYSADAVVFRTAASSFSAAALISTTSASNWPSNAIIKSAASVTFSSDAVARKESTSALSADAVLCKPTSFSFSGDAVARQTAVSGTSADATIQRTSSATPTTNAIIRLGQESSLSADAFVQPWFWADAYISAKLTADAVLRAEQVRTFTAGAWVQGTGVFGFSANAAISRSQSSGSYANALILATSSGLAFSGNAITRTENASSFALAAILSASSASSISSNAISLASATSTFLCAAVVRSSASWSLSADSLILRPVSTSLSSDSVVLKLTSLSFLADGVARRTPESALAGDAVVLRAIAMDLATNAIVLREQAGWLAADAWIQGSGLAGFSGDAVVRRTVEDSEPLDAIVRRTSQASLATSAIVRRAETLGLTANAVVFSASSGSFTAGACIAGTFTANTVIRKTNTGTATADSVVMPVFVGNAVLRRSQESSFVAGAWVPAQGIFGFGADSALRAVIGQAFSVNAIARIPVSGTLCADAVIAAEQNGAATADAVTQKGETGYLAASAVLVAGRTVGLSANSVLLSPEAGSASADAVLLASRGGTLTSDSTLRASRELPATADAVLRVTGSGSLAADAYILASEAAVLTASAVVLREQLAQFAGHALVNQVVQRGLDADATVQALHVGSLRADAVVQANPERAFQSHAVTLISVTESVNSNSVISASSTNSFSANSWVIDSKRFSTDAVISSSTGFSFPADGIVVLPTALFDAELDLEFLEASLSVDLFEAELTLEYIEASVFVELFEADLQLSLIEATVARAPWLWSAGRFSADAVVEA
jgi:hypothetical protein